MTVTDELFDFEVTLSGKETVGIGYLRLYLPMLLDYFPFAGSSISVVMEKNADVSTEFDDGVSPSRLVENDVSL